MNGFKQKKGTCPKFKMSLTNHARLRLFERFGLNSIKQLRENQIECLGKIEGGLFAYSIKDTDIVFIRNHRSHNVVTFLTKHMWENKDENLLV